MAHAKHWGYSTGERGRNRVRAFEDAKTGIILLEYYQQDEAGRSRRKRVSTKHRDRGRAKQQADELATRFGRNEPPASEGSTLHQLFELYLAEVTPSKASRTQAHDRARVKMFNKFFRVKCKPETLSRRDWDKFVQDRRHGRVRPAGSVREDGVGNQTIRADLSFLLAVLNWATVSRAGNGSRLLEHNPFRGLALPKEESPRRPVLTHDRYETMLGTARRMGWRFECMLELVHETGHRVGAVRQLRWADIDFIRGVIIWRADRDKLGAEHETPMTEQARGALVRARSATMAIGDAWIFPAEGDPAQPTRRDVVRNWWVRAEASAGLEHIKGLGWHSLRRKFATELKDIPLRDLCDLGGWKSAVTVMRCYQRPEESRMRDALASRGARRATGAS